MPSQVAENMHIPQATFIETANFVDGHIVAKRIIEGGYQMMKLPIPCTLSFTPTGIDPRRETLGGAVRARDKKVTVLNIDDINLSDKMIGLSGSPTIVAKVASIKSERAAIKMCDGHNEAELVESLIENIKAGKNTLEVKEKKATKEKKRPDGFEDVDFRNGASGILTWAEVVKGEISRPSLELLTPARHLASQLDEGTKVITLLIGSGVQDLAKVLIAHGADEVVVVDDERLEEYRILPFSTIFASVIKDKNPEIALFAATTAGRELAPRIGVKVDGGVTADCTALEIGEYINKKEKKIFYPILESKRPTYGESKLATILGFVCPQISTARAGTFEVPTPDESREGVIENFTPTLTDDDFVTEIIETVRGEGGLQNLFEADIIVAGGRGAVGDDMNLVKELATALREQGVNTEWASSRPMVDEGIAEYARQIGQTGKTVRPKVYIAIGISGAVQHIAGIKESETIVAINHNAKEPIFGNSDFGIVGEYGDILPELIEKVKGGFTFGIKVQ